MCIESFDVPIKTNDNYAISYSNGDTYIGQVTGASNNIRHG